jgi:hypothetical protein
MDKEAVQAQLLQTGLITRARLSQATEANVETLNEWAELVGASVRFFLDGKNIGWTGHQRPVIRSRRG